jgi:hypothetical protein
MTTIPATNAVGSMRRAAMAIPPRSGIPFPPMISRASATTAVESAFDQETVQSLWAPSPIDVSRFDLLDVRSRIHRDGYAIVKDLIDPAALAAIRTFWLDRYRSARPSERVNWSPYLGQSNMIGFSDDRFQCLFRSCDFLWNAPFEPTSRELCVYLSRVRNVIIEMPVLSGELYSEDRYGIFITTSYYPGDTGWMKVHTDGVASDLKLLHYVVPLTHKGIDYSTGGMVIVDRRGARVDVDAQMTPGSVVYYDGSLPHGVDRIKSIAGSSVGRLQMFAIPTLFTNVEDKQGILEKISYRALTKAKLSLLKVKVRNALGLEPSR